MKLYFLRHGIAEDIENAKGSDAARALTPKGIERMEISARVMAKLGVKPARLYSSPLTRARQTAEIVAKAVGVEVKIEPTVGPGFNPQAVSALIAGLSSADDVMFVGHEPDFSQVISALTGGSNITMKKGSLARLDVSANTRLLRCSLVWLIAPAVFVESEDDE